MSEIVSRSWQSPFNALTWNEFFKIDCWMSFALPKLLKVNFEVWHYVDFVCEEDSH